MKFKNIILLMCITFLGSIIELKAFIDNDSIAFYQSKINITTGREKVIYLLNLSELTKQRSVVSSFNYSFEALQIAQHLNDEYLQAICNYKISDVQAWWGDIKLAEKYINSVIYYTKNQNLQKFLGKCYIQKAKIVIRLNNYSLAINLFNEAIKISEEINDPGLKAEANYELGNLYYKLEEFDNAFTNAKMSIENINRNDRNIYLIYQYNVCAYKSYQKKFDSSDILINQALKALKNNDYFYKAYFYRLKGLNYLNSEKLDSALKYLDISCNYALKVNYNDLLGLNFTLMSHTYELKGDLKLSKLYNEKALYHRKLLGFKLYIASSYINLAHTYMLEQNYRQALKFLDSGLNYANQAQMIRYITSAYNKYYKTYKSLKMDDSAYKYLKLYMMMNDSLYKSENKIELYEYQAKIDITAQENHFKNLSLKNNERINLALYCLILALIIALGLIINRFFRAYQTQIFLRKKQLVLNEALDEAKIAQNELFTLNSQLEITVEERTSYLKNEMLKRKMVQEKLQQAKDEIAMAYENEKSLNLMKTRLMTIISKEYKTPINVIHASIELIKSFGDDNNVKKVDNFINNIKSSIKNMLKMIDDVLILGKMEQSAIQFNFEKFDLISFINQLVVESTVLDKNNHTITLINNVNSFEYNMDKKILRNILTNLLSNALKFSPDYDEIYMILNIDDESINIEIADRGIGIPENELKNIITPFFRASNSVNIPGNGFGLTIVRKYINLLNGDLHIDSVLHHGTQVRIKLPIDCSINE